MLPSETVLLFMLLGGAANVAMAEPASTKVRAQAPASPALGKCQARAAFSPSGGAGQLVLDTINNARSSIRMATYSFTEPAYAKALLDAKRRGVDVAIVSDKEHNGRRKVGTPSVVDFLRKNGVAVMVSDAFAIQHNKFIVVDGHTVQTGSLNYSRAGDKSNAENVLVLSQCKDVARAYLDNWQKLWKSGNQSL